MSAELNDNEIDAAYDAIGRLSANDFETVRRALEFYAEPISYALTQISEPRSAVHGDKGRRAREALALITKSE